MFVNYLYALPLWFVSLDMLLGVVLWAHHSSQKLRCWQVCNALLVWVALFGVLWVTLLRRSGPVESYVVLTPFHSLEVAKAQPEMYRELLMNALLFYPLGLTLSNVWPRRWKPGVRILLTVAVGCLLSVWVEYTQYRFSMGVSETDDVITNTLGTLFGASNLALGALMASKREEKRRRLSVPEGLLLSSMKAAVRGDSADWQEEISAENWRRLFELAEKQHVLPLVYQAVYGCPSASSEEGRGVLASVRGTAVARVLGQSVRTRRFLELYGKLREKGLHPLVVKGVLCRELYPQGDYRASGDEDLLIREDEWEAVCACLEQEGLSAQRSKEGEFECGFTGDGLYLELHRSLFSPDSEALSSLNGFFENAFERAESFRLQDGGEVMSLCPHDHFLYLILHTYKHFVYSGFGLRQILDIGLWAREYRARIDWERLASDCEQAHALTFAAAVLALAEQMLGEALRVGPMAALQPDTAPMLNDLLNGGIYGTADGSRLHSAQLTVNAVEASRNKRTSHLREVIFPSREKLQNLYPELIERPALLPLVWLRRSARYLKEIFTVDDNNALDSLRIARERTELLELYKVIE